jgi:hypothetical protein
MPKGKKFGGKDWKKGESGNPNGRPPLPPEVKAIRALTHQEIKELGEVILGCNRDDLELIVKNHEATVLRRWIAKVALNGLDHGNMMTLNALLDRIVGSTPKELKVTGNLHAQLMQKFGSNDDSQDS